MTYHFPGQLWHNPSCSVFYWQLCKWNFTKGMFVIMWQSSLYWKSWHWVSLNQMLICSWVLLRQPLRTQGHSVRRSTGTSPEHYHSEGSSCLPSGPEGEATTLWHTVPFEWSQSEVTDFALSIPRFLFGWLVVFWNISQTMDIFWPRFLVTEKKMLWSNT